MQNRTTSRNRKLKLCGRTFVKTARSGKTPAASRSSTNPFFQLDQHNPKSIATIAEKSTARSRNSPVTPPNVNAHPKIRSVSHS